MRIRGQVIWLALLGFGSGVGRAQPSTVDRPLPDEYESLGGHALTLNDGGVAALSNVSSVRGNPAMLAFERQYSADAGWHWPSRGRSFYDIGVVDSKTSTLAAGVLYRSFASENEGTGEQAFVDSPVRKRVVLGLGQPLETLALGVGGQYVEAVDVTSVKRKEVWGMGLNLGVAGLLTPLVRAHVSVENLANEEIRNYAPRVWRAGVAWLLAEGNTSLHFDLRDRQRVPLFEATEVSSFVGSGRGQNFSDNERMAQVSWSVKFMDLLRWLGGVNVSLTDDRRSVATGLSLANKGFSFSWAVQCPNLAVSKYHHALNVSADLSL
jgi:hypothetical protein